MDHGKDRMRLSELQEDLEYNISRKEELKKEVRKLKDEYESLYEVYMKNTNVGMDQNVEIADLKAFIEQQKRDNIEVRLENDKLKDKIESCEKEMSESETASNNMLSLQIIESENRFLKELIKSREEHE